MLPELYTFFIMAARYTGLDCTFMLRHRTLLRSLGIKELIKKKTLKYIYFFLVRDILILINLCWWLGGECVPLAMCETLFFASVLDGGKVCSCKGVKRDWT